MQSLIVDYLQLNIKILFVQNKIIIEIHSKYVSIFSIIV